MVVVLNTPASTTQGAPRGNHTEKRLDDGRYEQLAAHALHALHCSMKKTSIYLTEEEAESLKEASRRSGRSQSELIREGIRVVVRATGRHRRVFHSMGKGHGTGAPYQEIDPDDLYRHVMGHDR